MLAERMIRTAIRDAALSSQTDKRKKQEQILNDGENKPETSPQYLSNRCQPILQQIKGSSKSGMETDMTETLKLALWTKGPRESSLNKAQL